MCTADIIATDHQLKDQRQFEQYRLYQVVYIQTVMPYTQLALRQYIAESAAMVVTLIEMVMVLPAKTHQAAMLGKELVAAWSMLRPCL
jgi:hypothetical protein